jgi:tRNA threonylcarbamoyl adenosine modification protein YeaZ
VTTACLLRDAEVLAESATHGRSTGAQRVLADLDRLLGEAGVELGEVDAIVAGTGPGTFTGLRIGLATAGGLGYSLGVPVRGFGTLDALLCGEGVQVACVDARRGEVFAKGDGVELGAYPPERLRALLADGTVVAGEGAVRYREQLTGLEIPPDDSPLHVPWARHHAGRFERAGEPLPVYVRRPDADRVLAGGGSP